MQINQSNFTGSAQGSTTAQSQPNVGDLLQVSVKERVGNGEAIVSMKGTTATVKFEGQVPKQDKVHIEITGKNADGSYTVKVSDKGQTTSAEPNVTTNKGSDITDVVKSFAAKGIALSKDQVQAVQEFLAKGPGTVEEKLETLKMMAEKQINVSKDTIRAVHEALNGRPLSDSLQTVLDELDLPIQQKTPSNSNSQADALQQLKNKIMQEQNLSKAIEYVREALKNLDLPREVIQKLSQALQEAVKLQSIGRDGQARIQLLGHVNQLLLPSVGSGQPTSIVPKDAVLADAIKNLLKDVQKEASLIKVFDKVSALLNEQGGNQELAGLKDSLEKARQLLENGRELAARRELSNTLSQMSQQVGTAEPILSQAEQYAIQAAVQSLKLDSKNIIVTEITEKLSQLTIDFKNLKREITRNLDNISNMLENRNVHVKQILQSTIHKLDNAILKGDYLLYTDMSTEKKMLAASSKLAEARNLLNQGQISDANKIVKEVKASVENILFKPSDVKVKHYVSDKLGLEAFSSTRQMANMVQQTVQPFVNGEGSANQMYNMIRSLGLMHENDAGFSLVSKNGQPAPNENVKASLLRLMNQDDLRPQLRQQVEQVVQNITGQQLLNKPDSSGMQNLFFQLPFMMEKQVENMKIYVNSRKNGEKVDWENCSIYFVLETKRLGDVGVLLTSSEKNVSLTFRSNKEDLADKLEGFTEITQERFQEIGYQLHNMDVKPLTEEKADAVSASETVQAEKERLTPTFTEKGYDFSI